MLQLVTCLKVVWGLKLPGEAGRGGRARATEELEHNAKALEQMRRRNGESILGYRGESSFCSFSRRTSKASSRSRALTCLCQGKIRPRGRREFTAR